MEYDVTGVKKTNMKEWRRLTTEHVSRLPLSLIL
jgi:hypothetical protein